MQCASASHLDARTQHGPAPARPRESSGHHTSSVSLLHRDLSECAGADRGCCPRDSEGGAGCELWLPLSWICLLYALLRLELEAL
eukprot:4057490-Pleurochrysis_carterae.AAC.1